MEENKLYKCTACGEMKDINGYYMQKKDKVRHGKCRVCYIEVVKARINKIRAEQEPKPRKKYTITKPREAPNRKSDIFKLDERTQEEITKSIQDKKSLKELSKVLKVSYWTLFNYKRTLNMGDKLDLLFTKLNI
jgi:hypothetical protein